MKVEGKSKRVTTYALPGIPLLAALSLPVDAARLDAEVALGYDSNPVQLRDGKAMTFGRYVLWAQERIPLDGSGLDLALGADYRDFEGANDNYRLELRGDWTHPLADGRSTLTLSLDASLYRDRLVAADERNEAGAGLRYERVISARNELAWSARLRWLGYRNAALPWTGRPGGMRLGTAAGQGQGAGPGSGFQATRRDDLLGSVLVESTYHFSPNVDASLDAHYHRLSSAVAMEAYHQLGTGLDVRLTPAPRWHIELALDWHHRAYDQAPRHLQRDDDRLSLGAFVRYFVGDIELYTGAAFTDNDSGLAQADFRQTVTECGIGWTF